MALFTDWLGRTERSSDLLSENLLKRVAATFDQEMPGITRSLRSRQTSSYRTLSNIYLSCLAAYMTEHGLTGAQNIFEGDQGMAAGMSSDADPSRLADGLGSRWALAEASVKFHASCRHTHPAADALLALMARENLEAKDIIKVVARVHQGAINVLGRVGVPQAVPGQIFDGHCPWIGRYSWKSRAYRVSRVGSDRYRSERIPRASFHAA